jgi:sarcosine oxidase, subunit alpha
VKHDKPNFLGNQPLARISKEGPKQKLVGFKMVTAGMVPEEGLQIVRVIDDRGSKIDYRNLEIIGWVTSCRFSPTLNEVIGLCWLPAKLAEQEGAAFTIRREGKLVEARVHHGAFYDVEGERLRM